MEKKFFSSGKISFIFWLTLLLIFIIPLPLQLPGTPLLFFLAIFAEFIIGALIGFVTQLFIVGIEFGGSLMDTQAGLSVASILDPSTGQTTSILSKLLRQIGVLVFINQWPPRGFRKPRSKLSRNSNYIKLNIFEASRYVTNISVDIFLAGLQIAAPSYLSYS